MSHYTTEVRYICETTAGLTESQGFNSIDSILDNCTDSIFDFDYPIFDEEYRFPLNKKILRHFYTREIGEETVGLWKLRLQQTLNEIMPYYNKLYESELLDLNPLYNIDLKTTRDINGDKIQNTDENGRVDTSRTGTRTENLNEHKKRTGTDTDNTKNIVDRTNNGSDTITKTLNGSEKDKKVVDTEYGDQHQNEQEKIANHELTSDSSVVKKGDSTDRYSDTPQGGLNGMEMVDNNLWLTNARIIDNKETTTTHSYEQGLDDHNVTDIYRGQGEGKETTTDNKSKAQTEKQTGTNKVTAKETGTKTGTKNINENTDTTGTNTRRDDFDVNTVDNKTTSGRTRSTEAYLEKVSGYKGARTFAEQLIEYRKSFLNIDRMILKDLETCFFQLW